MLIGSEHHARTCEVCAEACDACAKDCDQFDDDIMKRCADICRRCAESCRQMAGSRSALERATAAATSPSAVTATHMEVVTIASAFVPMTIEHPALTGTDDGTVGIAVPLTRR